LENVSRNPIWKCSWTRTETKSKPGLYGYWSQAK